MDPKEAAALIAEVGKTRRWRVLAATDAECTIQTRPQGSWRAFANQHTRWNIGGFFSSDLATRVSYRFLVLYLTASMLLLPAGIAVPALLVFAANAVVSIGLLAALESAIYPVRGWRDRLLVIPMTLGFAFFYSYITLRTVLRSRPEWKGSTLEPRG